MSLSTQTPVWTEDAIEKVKKESLKYAEKTWQKLEEEGIYTPEQLGELVKKFPERFGGEEELLEKLS